MNGVLVTTSIGLVDDGIGLGELAGRSDVEKSILGV